MEQALATTPPTMSPAVVPTTVCPRCGHPHGYRLGDGRLMCRLCRGKFTPHPSPGRLSASQMSRLTERFWRMDSIARAARELGLNKKTVEKRYRWLRRRMAEHSQIQVPAPANPLVAARFVGSLPALQGLDLGADTVTVFGVCVAPTGVHLVLPRHQRDWTGLDLRGLSLVPNPQAGAVHHDLCRQFWEYASPRLRHYRGGVKRQLPLYLREMEFRFNHRHATKPPEVLCLSRSLA